MGELQKIVKRKEREEAGGAALLPIEEAGGGLLLPIVIVGGAIIGAGAFLYSLITKPPEEEPPEEPPPPPPPTDFVMSPSKSYTRGFSGWHTLNFENHTNLNLTQLKLKLIDAKGIFGDFHVMYKRIPNYYTYYLYEPCLNAFQAHNLLSGHMNYDFPAQATRGFYCGGPTGGYAGGYDMGVVIKDSAPLGTHTVVFEVKFQTYAVPEKTKRLYGIDDPLKTYSLQIPWKVTIIG